MADVKISQLPAATTPLAGTEQIPLVQGATTKQVTVSNLLTTANLGTPTAINLTNATNVPVNQATGILPVANGGSGTATPSIVGGTNIAVTGTWPNQTISATGSAAGNVTGPLSSTDNAVVRFDNTTGQVIQNSGVIINDSDEISGGTWKGTPVAVAYGGTGTTTPSLVAGTNVTISGTWPNQTINSTASGSVTSVTGTAPVVSSGGATPAISMAKATTSVDGYLSATDWNTFNNKQPAGSYVTSGGALGTPSSGTATNLTGLPLSTGVTGTLPVANGGTGTTTPSLVAGTNVTISGTWPNQTINSTGGGGGGSGTVTDVSVVSANGLAGTVANSTTTPAITLSTSVTGIVKGNGTALSAATAGTDYVAPGGALGTPSSGTLTNTTGLPLSTGVTGTLPIANGGSGQTTAQTAMNAFAGAVTSGSYLRGNGTNVVMATIQAADVPTLNQNTTGSAGSVANALTAGTGISFSSGTTYNGSAAITINNSGVASYPSSGIPNSTGSAWGTSYSTSGTGTVVALTTSPTFVTPALGTPSSATLTNATGLPISTGVSGLGTGVATALAVAVGSAGAPVVNGGALGTPSSGTLTNATGLPLSTGVTGTLPVANGGTGLTTTPANGALDIGNGTGFTRTTLTAGSGISVTNASGSITIAATGGGGGTSIGLVRALAVNCILC